MLILFVDDEIKRIQKFKSFYPDCISTTGSMSAIKIIEAFLGKIDYLFLDHDLDITQEYNPLIIKGTGIEITKYIVTHKPIIKKIIVHSCKYYGSKAMTEMLIKAGYNVWQAPFSLLELPLIEHR